jgi:tetratricopeptide (TPR) repeat protein
MNKSMMLSTFTVVLLATVLSGCVKEGVKILPPFDENVVAEECAVLSIPHDAKVKRIDGKKRGLLFSWSPWHYAQASLLVPAGEHTILYEYEHETDGWSAKNLQYTITMERGKTYRVSATLDENAKVGTGSPIINKAASKFRDEVIDFIPFMPLLPRPNPKGLTFQIDEIAALDQPLEGSGKGKGSIGEVILIILVYLTWLSMLNILNFYWHIIFMGKFMNRHRLAAIFLIFGLSTVGTLTINYNSSGILSLYVLATLLLSIGLPRKESLKANRCGLEKLEHDDYEGAVSDFTQAIFEAPYDANCIFNRGVAYCGLQEWEKAAADFDEAFRLKPDTLFRENLDNARAKIAEGGGSSNELASPKGDRDRLIRMSIKMPIIVNAAIMVLLAAVVFFAERESHQYYEMTLLVGMTEDAAANVSLYDGKAVTEIKSLAEASNWIRRNAEKDGIYTIVLGADQSAEKLFFGYGGKKVAVTLTSAGGGKTITRSGDSRYPIIIVNGIRTAVTLEDGITLSGTGEANDGANSLVRVDSGAFSMNGNIITGGKNSAAAYYWGIICFILGHIAVVFVVIRSILSYKNEGTTLPGNIRAHGTGFSVLWWFGILALLIAGYFFKKLILIDASQTLQLLFGALLCVIGIIAGAITGGRLAEDHSSGAGEGAALGAVGFAVSFVIIGLVSGITRGSFSTIIVLAIAGVIIGAVLGAILGAIGSALNIEGRLIGGLVGIIGGGSLGVLLSLLVYAMLKSSLGTIGATELVLAGSFGLFSIYSPENSNTFGKGRVLSLVLLLFTVLSLGIMPEYTRLDGAITASLPAMPTATVTPDALNFRAGPGVNSAILSTLHKGDSLSVTGEAQDGWLPVEYDGKQGFVSAEFVNIESK